MPLTVQAVPTAAPGSRRRRIILSVILAGIAVLLVLAPGAGSARAANTDILVSLDGANWSATLPLGLFSGAGTVVPGDSISRTLWIKNTTSSAAVLRLSRLQNMAGSSLLARSISITATGRGTGGPPPAPQDASCVQLLPDQVVPGGRSTSTVVTLRVADLQGGEAQGQSATISLIASLSAVGGTAASPCLAGGTDVPVVGSGQALADTGGSLAFTGAGLPYPAIMIASLLTGLGLFVILAARRRRRAE
jgi:hypothetical protein